MKKQFKMGPILLPIVQTKKEGEQEEEDSEVAAISAIKTQVDNFAKVLGEKADASKIDDLKTQLEDLQKGLDTLTGAEVLSQIKNINEANEKLYQEVVKMQEEKAEEAEKSTPSKKQKSLVTTAEVTAFVKNLFPEEGSEKNHVHSTLTVKAAEQFGYNSFASGADVSAFTGRFIDPTLYQRKRKKNIILDYFNIQTINVPTLIYLRKIEEGPEPDTDDTGGAAWIACGQQKPMRSFRVTTGEAQAKKVAIFNTIDDCLLQDVPSFERWIREDFIDEMREEINDGLLNGDPEVNALQPTGLKKNAILFSATAAFDENVNAPTYIDAIFAIAARFAVNRESLAYIFVSADVFYAIHALKATDGKYLNNQLVYVNNLGQLFIAGVEVVPVDEEDVPQTHFLAVGADVGFKIYAYGDMTIETGLNGNDFREDKTSIRGWQRFLSFIPEDRENSVMYDTWANVFAAIATPVEAPETPAE